MRNMLWLLGILVLGVDVAAGQTIEVQVETAKVRSALAEVRSMQLLTRGSVEGGTVRFDNLLPNTPYDLEISLEQDRTLVGVNMRWYEPMDTTADSQAEPLTDSDREEIRAIVQDVPSFYDSADLLKLAGNHDRAVALVQLERRRAFHNAAPGEIIWRVELYYFQFQAGGWEKVQQVNEVLRRKRFANSQQYEDEAMAIIWSESLGGITVGEGETRRIGIAIPAKPSAAGAAE